ncbi:TPA: hypothetical protein L6B08_26855 [Pseudomonas aeruginosa]|nr:hypothetical protein [Pseudomonas aeruginosa]
MEQAVNRREVTFLSAVDASKVDKFLADKRGYTLNLSKPCFGTTQFYNRHVYGTLNLNDAESMSAYYAEMELADRLRGHPKESDRA